MSGLKRFFVNSISDTVVVDGEEFSHAITTLRLRNGDKIILLDGSGYDYTGEVISVDKKSFTAKILDKTVNVSEPKTEIILICGYLKGDKTELVCQKAVELGVSKIVVFSSEFSSSYINDNKLLRLNKVTQEAVKQCGRAKKVEVLYADSFEKALEYGENFVNKLFACEFINENSTELKIEKGSVAIVVGSEGGFSKSEADVAFNKNYKTVSLGNRILRAETACIALTSIVSYLAGELK